MISYRTMALKVSVWGAFSMLAMLVVLACPSCFGDDSAPGGSLKISVENWGGDDKIPRVEDDARNLRVEPRGADQREFPRAEFPLGKALESSEPPSYSVATQVFDARRVYHWRPNWFYIGAGQVRLPAVVLSEDKSVLALVETIGARDGPYGSRIVLIDTYRWLVARVIELKRRRVTHMVFGSTPTDLICWCQRQPSLRRVAELVIVDARSGTSTSKAFADLSISAMALDAKRNRLLLKSADSAALACFKLENVAAKPGMYRVGVEGGPLAVSPDGSRVALGGTGLVKVFSLENFKPTTTIKLNQASAAEKIVFADSNHHVAVLLANDVVTFLKNRFQTTLTDMAAGPLRYEAEAETLIVGELKNDEIKLFPVPNLTPASSVFPSKLKPRTRAEIDFIAYLRHLDKYLILDDNGNLYVIYKPGRRWKKHLIFSAMK